MNILLTPVEARILGALVEKEITTPDYYPLSLNALVNACNQKSNRDPAMTLEEGDVRDALYELDRRYLAAAASGADSRVTKYEHRLQEVFNFNRPETAIMCELLLRGPQTPGELRSRGERMYRFDDLSQVQSTLQRLINHEPPLVKMLPRQPGTKEARYAHLLCGDVEVAEVEPPSAAMSGPDGDPRIARLEHEVAELRRDVVELRQQMADFRKQFE